MGRNEASLGQAEIIPFIHVGVNCQANHSSISFCFLLFYFLHLSKLFHVESSAKQAIGLTAVLVFLCRLWAGSDFSLLPVFAISLFAPCFAFPNAQGAAVVNTWLSPQNSSPKSAPLLWNFAFTVGTGVITLTEFAYREKRELLYIYLNLYCWCPPSQLLFSCPLYYQMITLYRFLDCAISYLLMFLTSFQMQDVFCSDFTIYSCFFFPYSLSFAPILVCQPHTSFKFFLKPHFS